MIKRLFVLFFLLVNCLFLRAQNEETALRFLHFLNQFQADSAFTMLSPEVKEKANVSVIGQTWISLISVYGQLLDTNGIISEKKSDDHTVVHIGLKFEKTTLDLKVNLNEESQIIGFFLVPPVSKIRWEAPSYADTSRFSETRLRLNNHGYELHGTLALPKNSTGKKLPLLILAHGSGPQDRDETTGPNKVFKDIAWGLASKGIAVFRFDKRTYTYGQKSAENPDQLTIWDETINDLVFLADTLGSLPGIDPDNISLLGHSLSGYVAPRILEASPRISKCILACAPARALDSVLLEQFSLLAAWDTTGEIEFHLESLREEVAFLRGPDFSIEVSENFLPLGLNAFYWNDLLHYAPLQTMKNSRQPVLVIGAGLDYQVTRTDFELWKNLASQRRKMSFKWYPELGHGLFPVNGVQGPGQYAIPAHVAPQVIQDLIRFLR